MESNGSLSRADWEKAGSALCPLSMGLLFRFGLRLFSLRTLTCRLFSFTVFYPCSSTFFSIRAVRRSATFWINSTFIVISNVLRFSSRPLGIVPKAPITMGITLASAFSHLISLSGSWYLSTFSCSFSSTLVSQGTAVSIRSVLFSLSTTTMSDPNAL